MESPKVFYGHGASWGACGGHQTEDVDVECDEAEMVVAAEVETIVVVETVEEAGEPEETGGLLARVVK